MTTIKQLKINFKCSEMRPFFVFDDFLKRTKYCQATESKAPFS